MPSESDRVPAGVKRQQALDGAELVRINTRGDTAAIWKGGRTLNIYTIHEGEWEPVNSKEWMEKPTRSKVDVAAKNILRSGDPEYIPNDQMAIECEECGHVGMDPIGDPRSPPDPDAHGNMRRGFRCLGCEQRGTLLTASHGGTKVSRGYFSLIK